MALDTALPRPTLLRTVFAKTIRDQRKALAWWAVGIVGTVLMYASFWPSVRDNAEQFNRYLKDLPEFLSNLIGGLDFATPEGYLQSELFSFIGPILMLVYAVGAGSRAIAGEEEARTLDLLLSVPVRRRRVLLDKFAAMAMGTLVLTLVMWISVLLLGQPFDLRPDLGGFTAMTLNTFLLGLAFGTLALAIGSATGRRALAIGIPSGIAVASFIVNALAPSVDWLEPFRLLSLFYYYSGGDPFLNGLDPVHASVLLAVTAVALASAAWTFERRDLAA